MSFGKVFAGVRVARHATLSPGGVWRYTLERVWDPSAYVLPACLLNPSFADAERDDNTVKVLMAYAHRLRFGGLRIVNPWALVSTDPSALKTAADPIGPENDYHITETILTVARAARVGRMMLCGWGDAGTGPRTDSIVQQLLSNGVRPVCIAVTKSGNPGHPLRKRLPPEPFEWLK